jgi:hypothetical protein
VDVKIEPQKIKKERNIMFEMLDVFPGRLEGSPLPWRTSWKATKNNYLESFIKRF